MVTALRYSAYVMADADGGQFDAGAGFDFLDHRRKCFSRIIAAISRQG